MCDSLCKEPAQFVYSYCIFNHGLMKSEKYTCIYADVAIKFAG